MGIFRTFSHCLDAIERLASTVEDLGAAQRELAPARERLEALELSRHQFEAEVAGVLLEAKGKLRAASNSEARERQLKRSYEKDSDSFDEDGEAGSGKSPILPDDVAASETERVSALRLDLAPSDKASAIAAKWRGF